jgi:PKD repeat protein
MTRKPTVPKGDSLYEDLSGDGVVNFSDVSLYFNNLDWIRANEPVSLFDYNKNGAIDFGDIILLNQNV